MATRSEKLEFEGARGHVLAGRLELPLGDVRAYGVFAHCFTCGKDIAAAARVSRGLAERGFGVLRFDFTGLGGSGGDFANTTFSSNIEDLVAAAEHVAATRGPVRFLVGHSLGGAAVLAAAGRVGSVEAVATIAAPSDPAHVEQHISKDAIEQHGSAEVELGGRTFRIERSFLDDLAKQSAAWRAGESSSHGKALLVMHSPADRIVPIEHAERIYRAARGFRSFVTLADADHLLSNPADAEYAADVLAAWLGRYVTPAESRREAPPDGVVLVAELGARYANRVAAGEHEWVADEPESLGGGDAGPAPFEHLLAGLGACTSMTLRMYAERKGWPLERVSVRLSRSKDAAGADGAPAKERFVREIELTGGIDAEQRRRLVEIAERCPVHRTLEAGVVIATREAT